MQPQSTTPRAVVYRDVPGWPGYRVGDDGSVWSCKPWRGSSGWRRMALYALACSESTGKKHYGVRLFRDGRSHPLYTHRLVLEAFVGPCPEGMECCHIDGDPSNNRLENLRWDTRQANVTDMLRHGTALLGERCSWAKLTAKKVRLIRQMLKQQTPHRAIAETFRVSAGAIQQIARGRTWKWLDNPEYPDAI